MRNRSVRVGLVGVGNCASSFVQGVTHYAGAMKSPPVQFTDAEARARTLRFIDGADRDVLQ